MQPAAPSSPSPVDDSSADRLYDLSLRILMVVVSVGLVGSVAFLTYRWLAPPRPAQVEVPVVEVGVKPAQTAKQPEPKPAPAQVLMNPGRIFKCEVNGRVTFSEQPCSAANAANADKAGAAKAGTDKFGTDKASTEKAGTEKAGTENAGAEKAGTEKTGIEAGKAR